MAKYTVKRPSCPSSVADASFDGNCYCPGCNKPILAGQMIREQAVYKCGELDYISVGHAECCPHFDNAPVPQEDLYDPSKDLLPEEREYLASFYGADT